MSTPPPLRPDGRPVKLRKGWTDGFTTLRIPNPLLLELSPGELKVTCLLLSYSYRAEEWYAADEDIAGLAGVTTKTVQTTRKKLADAIDLDWTPGNGRGKATVYRLKVEASGDLLGRKVEVKNRKGGSAVPPFADKGGSEPAEKVELHFHPVIEVEALRSEVDTRSEVTPPKAAEAGGSALVPVRPDSAPLGKPGSALRLLSTLPMSPAKREKIFALTEARKADGMTEDDLLLIYSWGAAQYRVSGPNGTEKFRGLQRPEYLWSELHADDHLRMAREWSQNRGGMKEYNPDNLSPEERAADAPKVLHMALRDGRDPKHESDHLRLLGYTDTEIQHETDRAHEKIEQRQIEAAARQAALPPHETPAPAKPETWTQRKAKTIAHLDAILDRLITPSGDLARDKVEWKRQIDAANAALTAAKTKTRTEWEQELGQIPARG